jgi:uncharacterized protein
VVVLMDSAPYHLFSFRGEFFLIDIERSFLYSISSSAHHEIAKAQLIGNNESFGLLERLGARIEWRHIRKKIRCLSEQEIQRTRRKIQSFPRGLAGLWLGISHQCNLACDYCFASNPAYLGTNKLMPVEIAVKAVDYLNEHSGDNDQLSIIFFGGEPLLNLPAVKAVVAHCRRKENVLGKRFTFSMTTNGTLLSKEVFEELQGFGIFPMVSMDGTPELHNRHRRTKTGMPTWDIIVRNLERIPNFGDCLSVRATCADDDLDLVESLKSLQNLGFKHIALADLCPNSGLKLNENSEGHLETWKKRFEELVDHTLKTASCIEEIPELGLRDAVVSIKNRHRSYFSCSTGRHHFYVDPVGDFYPCFRLMSPDGSRRVGSLQGSLREDVLRELFEANVLTTSCSSCWARYLCGGPCFGDSFSSHGNLSTPDPTYCFRQKFVLESAAYVLYHLDRICGVRRQNV